MGLTVTISRQLAQPQGVLVPVLGVSLEKPLLLRGSGKPQQCCPCSWLKRRPRAGKEPEQESRSQRFGVEQPVLLRASSVFSFVTR